MEKIGRAADKGVTTVLMQGGLNSDLPLDYYTEMVSETVLRYPSVTPHYWSAPEIMKMCEVSGKSIREVMQALWDAGQRTMPGGGSEILSNRVKAEISRFKPKDTVDQWTEVHVEAHRVGFVTTGDEMMYGHVESDEDIIESLVHIRNVQDRSAGEPGEFTAFIPWSYKRDNTALARKVAVEAGANRYVRLIALSRIFLDNVPHIQASWFSEGRKTGQIALQFGADDFGGTLVRRKRHACRRFLQPHEPGRNKGTNRGSRLQSRTAHDKIRNHRSARRAARQIAICGCGCGRRMID